jgi:hypothetical protein
MQCVYVLTQQSWNNNNNNNNNNLVIYFSVLHQQPNGQLQEQRKKQIQENSVGLLWL